MLIRRNRHETLFVEHQATCCCFILILRLFEDEASCMRITVHLERYEDLVFVFLNLIEQVRYLLNHRALGYVTVMQLRPYCGNRLHCLQFCSFLHDRKFSAGFLSYLSWASCIWRKNQLSVVVGGLFGNAQSLSFMGFWSGLGKITGILKWHHLVLALIKTVGHPSAVLDWCQNFWEVGLERLVQGVLLPESLDFIGF